ncbi:MAG: hypothetical protein GEV05_00265 [Betaproteobacteria bacterium]|nr:hypothetical protein [Betaproteobacteria bacterium]
MSPARASMFVFVGWLAAGTPASAQSRWVIVNGERMSDAQVAYLERRACTQIPNGQYWLDTQTGAWGYARNPQVQGRFGEACRQPRKSLSERRQLYRPGEILSQ